MAGPSITVSSRGFTRIAAHVRNIKSGADLARQRAIGTLVRRMQTEAVREISTNILNLPPSKVRPNIRASKVNGESPAVILSATKNRLPLTDYNFKITKGQGATGTTWRDQGAITLPHAFARPGHPGVWFRVPFTGAKLGKGHQQGGNTDTGLVGRLPIVRAVGPDIKRVFITPGGKRAHGDVAESLRKVARDVLRAEVNRLLAKGLA